MNEALRGRMDAVLYGTPEQAMHAAIAERVRRLVRCALFAPAPRFTRLQRQMARPAVLARWQRWLATRRPASRSALRASGSSGGAP